MDAEMNPSLLCRILNEDVGWPVARVARLRQLSRKGAPVFVGQATLEGDSTLPSSVVVKVIPLAPVYGVLSDGRPAEAEALWHSALSKAGAPLPQLFWHGLVADKGRLLMITEDMDEGRRNKDPEAQWSLGQMEAVMEAIGAFHVAGRSLDHSEIRAANPWLRHMSLEAIDGAWIRRLVALDRDLGTPIPEEAVSVVLELADRYDA